MSSRQQIVSIMLPIFCCSPFSTNFLRSSKNNSLSIWAKFLSFFSRNEISWIYSSNLSLSSTTQVRNVSPINSSISFSIRLSSLFLYHSLMRGLTLLVKFTARPLSHKNRSIRSDYFGYCAAEPMNYFLILNVWACLT